MAWTTRYNTTSNLHIKTPTLAYNDKHINSINCGAKHSIIYKNNGDVIVFGFNNQGQLGLGNDNERGKPSFLMNDKNICIICCGYNHSIIYKYNGDILVFGWK